MAKQLLNLILAVACYGCVSGHPIPDAWTINPLESTRSVTDIGKYIDRVEPIPLRSPDSIVVSGITKMLLDGKGDFILTDGARLYKFDRRGAYRLRYGNVGRGPGEYLKIFDICLNQKQTELWCLNYLNEVLKYDLESGKYLGIVSTHAQESNMPQAAALIPGPDDGFYLYTPNPGNAEDLENPFYRLKQFDRDGKLVGEQLLRTDFNIDFNMIPYVTQVGGAWLLRPQENENICYRVRDKEVSRHWKIHFGKDNVPPLYMFRNERNPWLNLEGYMTSDYYKNPFYLQETAQTVFFSAFGPENRIYYFLIDKDSTKGINWNSGDLAKTTPFFIAGSDRDAFYGIFDKYVDPAEAGTVSDPLLSYLMDANRLRLDAEMNPIIVKIRFKRP